MSQSSDEEDDLRRFDAESSSDDDDDGALLAPTAIGSTAVKREAMASGDEGVESKRIRVQSEAAVKAEATRALAELEREQERQAKLIRAREKVQEKALPTPAVAATQILKHNPDRAGLIETARDLEKMNMKQLKRLQEEEYARMHEAGAEALTADRQRILAAAQMWEIPQYPPTVDIFSRVTANATRNVLATRGGPPTPVAGETRELLDTLGEVHRKMQKNLSDPHAAAFLRSGVINTMAAVAPLPLAVAEWLLTVITNHPDHVAVHSCAEALLLGFVEGPHHRDVGWSLSARRVVTALCDLGATEDALGVSGAVGVGGEDEGADKKPVGDTSKSGEGIVFGLHNLQKLVEVVERGARGGAVDASEACELLRLMFKLTEDRRTVALTFNMQRAVTELLQLPQQDAWPGVREELADTVAQRGIGAAHYHRIVCAVALLAPQGKRARELRASIARRFVRGFVEEMDLDLNVGAGDSLDDIGYYCRVLKLLDPHISNLSTREGGLYRLFCMYELLDSTILLEFKDSSTCERIEKFLIRLLSSHCGSVSKAGEYDLSRADCRTIVHFLKAAVSKYSRIVKDSAPVAVKRQTTLSFKTAEAAAAH